jgi:hypothetical protein
VVGVYGVSAVPQADNRSAEITATGKSFFNKGNPNYVMRRDFQGMVRRSSRSVVR